MTVSTTDLICPCCQAVGDFAVLDLEVCTAQGTQVWMLSCYQCDGLRLCWEDPKSQQ